MRFILLLTCLCWGLLLAEAPIVTSVTASQRTDGSKIVDIYYDVVDIDGDTLSISVLLSDDSGETFAITPDTVNLSGDVGDDVMPGAGKHISWNTGSELNTFEEETYSIQVIADDGTIPPVYIQIPAGSFTMGRTTGTGDADELPTHPVNLNAFNIGVHAITNQQVIDIYNWAFGQGYIDCTDVTVTNIQGDQQELLDLDDGHCAIDWNGTLLEFGGSIHAIDAECPCIEITWYGAVAYCNYQSLQEGFTPCYDLSDWSCDWTAN
ncbi:MAG: formylglycine-generating enzyme family protein, partial [Candidatus Cloacimonetes bacterium]|nr:formylglycine-generating enzyme family protein [Candidatus Cloacimonadota bacterium]